ncbi:MULTISPECIES: ParB N-terminal domain-containing protein [Bacillus]|uniref:ParB-like N-terminal domain-containing protein n=1 Tax=Bacillus thuringiensis serovar mexicanensis TaxID=180868 RepID=A0A2C9YH60_BACTU|nr:MULTISPECIES: ParB N-terminal domain-containing protein [Bacillus cereus group]EEM55807.1 hypothetical protein bthur0007_64020 [Bacillus thuringiensis serovar monterrey BGSC 4AJ1]MEB9673543.1 ParB N-terminal domain-containing protein [Bacillus anthracis]OTW46528.1 hypothetical protein BK699_19930 [Bacillus thuringiensis serovar mexicanensis]OTX06257.1 hypothetical protein BK705_10855 [Bacillus thuringiensis serovar monterrey]PGD64017.1 hypothetical protein COM41_12190 [Bacillus wiedmannii]
MFDEALSKLNLIKTSQLRYHEKREENRLNKLMDRLQQSKILKNPPIALQLNKEVYLIIDGAHRVSALEKMGCEYIPVQVVDVEDLQLDLWNHEIPIGKWFDKIKSNKNLLFTENELEKRMICKINYSNGEKLYVYSHYEEEFFYNWDYIVSCYTNEFNVNRLASWNTEVSNLSNVIFQFESLTLSQITQIVINGGVLPAGVTRFNIKGRLLNLEIPLSLLFDEQIDSGKWSELTSVWARSLRYYENSVFVHE